MSIFRVDIRPPVVERTFSVPKKLQWLLGSASCGHTIEPQIIYRDVKGINNFLGVLRFDDVDLASDTNELDYSTSRSISTFVHALLDSARSAKVRLS